MLSIFSCVSWPPVCLLWRNVYISSHFWLSYLGFFFFFWYWATWAVCIFWKLIPCHLLRLQIFFPIWGLSFCSVFGFVCCAKAFRSHLFLFLFSLVSEVGQEVLTANYVRKCSAYVFLQEFHSIWTYILVFNAFSVYFCVWC